jgi:Kef-type K+ transport system membrane component KefB
METSLQVLLLISVLLLCAKAMGHLSGWLGLPLVLGELLAGVLLGPTLLDIWSLPPFTGGAHPEHLRPVFTVLAELGVVVLMFLAGLETDLAMMRAAVKPAFWSACGGVVLPMIGGCMLGRAFGLGWSESIFIGTILTATSVTITAQTLMNMGQLQSRAGSTILGAAVIDDVLGLMVLSVVVAMNTALAKGQSFDWARIGISLIQMAGFLGLSFFFGPRLIARIFHHTSKSEGTHLSSSVALALSFLFSFAAVYGGGMAAITGAYIAGLFAAMSPVREHILENLRAMCNAFFGPLFLVSIGLEINARNLGDQLFFLVLAILIAVLGKIVGCGIGARMTGFGTRESVIVGIGMIPRGEVGLITATLGWAGGIISKTVYLQVVVLVLLSTLITPPLLRIAFGKSGPTDAAAASPSRLTATGAGR